MGGLEECVYTYVYVEEVAGMLCVCVIFLSFWEGKTLHVLGFCMWHFHFGQMPWPAITNPLLERSGARK